jgi:hypothetical protein
MGEVWKPAKGSSFNQGELDKKSTFTYLLVFNWALC